MHAYEEWARAALSRAEELIDTGSFAKANALAIVGNGWATLYAAKAAGPVA